MNKAIALITDSTCDIPQELIQQYEIAVIPQLVIWGQETLRDRIDITPEAFYQRLETDQRHPTTTLPSPAEVEKIYKNVIAQGAQQILALTISSALSGTYQLVKKMGEEMSVPVQVIDFRGPTMSLGWQVLAAARAREAGAAIEEMIGAADRCPPKAGSDRLSGYPRISAPRRTDRDCHQIPRGPARLEAFGKNQSRDWHCRSQRTGAHTQKIHRSADRILLRKSGLEPAFAHRRVTWQRAGRSPGAGRTHQARFFACRIADQYHRACAGNQYRSVCLGFVRIY